jgi:hypothetical protein
MLIAVPNLSASLLHAVACMQGAVDVAMILRVVESGNCRLHIPWSGVVVYFLSCMEVELPEGVQ